MATIKYIAYHVVWKSVSVIIACEKLFFYFLIPCFDFTQTKHAQLCGPDEMTTDKNILSGRMK
jgi:hypothetical protein